MHLKNKSNTVLEELVKKYKKPGNLSYGVANLNISNAVKQPVKKKWFQCLHFVLKTTSEQFYLENFLINGHEHLSSQCIWIQRKNTNEIFLNVKYLKCKKVFFLINF